MAYLAFDGVAGAPAPTAIVAPVAILAAEQAASAEQERLGALEWAVIAVARNDGLASLREPGRMSVAFGNVFGRRTNPRLADPKLEALRRMAVLAWHFGFAVPVSEVKAFLAAGFTTDHYETVLASIGAARLNRKLR